MLEWERQHHEPLETTPAEVLASLMEEHGVSQYGLEKAGIADQSLLSKILSSKRGISRALAKRLGKRFQIEPSVFL